MAARKSTDTGSQSSRSVILAGESEEAHQIWLFDWVRFLEPEFPDLKWIYHVPNGGKRSIAVARKMKRGGLRPGIWDVSCDTARQGYKGFRFELKFGRNKLTEEQVAWEIYYRENGYLTGVFYSWVDCALAIADYFDLPEHIKWGLRQNPQREAA